MKVWTNCQGNQLPNKSHNHSSNVLCFMGCQANEVSRRVSCKNTQTRRAEIETWIGGEKNRKVIVSRCLSMEEKRDLIRKINTRGFQVSSFQTFPADFPAKKCPKMAPAHPSLCSSGSSSGHCPCGISQHPILAVQSAARRRSLGSASCRANQQASRTASWRSWRNGWCLKTQKLVLNFLTIKTSERHAVRSPFCHVSGNAVFLLCHVWSSMLKYLWLDNVP